MLVVVLATLAKLVVILKLGLRSILKRITSLIFLNMYTLPQCFDSYNSLCFKIIDKVNSKFELKIKEVLHINLRKPNLNAQQNHLALVPFAPFCLCSFFFCCFLHFTSSIIFIISTLIIGTFYCLNYTLLLLHLFITHLMIDFTINM